MPFPGRNAVQYVPQTPFKWTQELVNKLCDHIASGGAIDRIAGTQGLPSAPTIYLAMSTNAAFREQVNQARTAQQESEVDAMIRMADEATPEDWQVQKLRIWARQWRAGKLAPKKYGDKMMIGGDADSPLHLKTTVTHEILNVLTIEQLEQIRLITNAQQEAAAAKTIEGQIKPAPN